MKTYINTNRAKAENKISGKMQTKWIYQIRKTTRFCLWAIFFLLISSSLWAQENEEFVNTNSGTNKSYTFEVPANVYTITVQAWGGGGAGGGISTSNGNGGGGGGGGFANATFNVTPGSNVGIIVGTRGVAVANSGNGGTTNVTFGGISISASGGNGGTWGNPGSGGTGGIGSITGTTGTTYIGGTGSASSSGNWGGGGGGSAGTGSNGISLTIAQRLGAGAVPGGGPGGNGNTLGAGSTPTTGPGGGGGGARRTTDQEGNYNGGDGAAGKVIITYTPIPEPTITSFTPTSACTGSGTLVTITGTNFTGATSVKFNGTDAVFTVNSSTQITATLPALATTGPISVTTPDGTGTSSTNFTVSPLPTATISGSPTICEGSPAEISVTFGGTPPWSIVLESGSGAQVTIDNILLSSYTLSVYPTTSTTYTIVSVTDANCTNTASGSASVTVLPTASVGSVIPATSAVCLGSSTGTLTLTGYSGYDILKWQKRLGTGDWEDIAHTSDTYSETPSLAGTWEYRALTEATGGGCPNISTSALVDVNPRPTALLGGNNQICDGEETTLNIYVTATGAWNLMLSDGSTVTGNGTGFVTKTVSPTTNTTYTLTSLSDATCAAQPGDLTGSAIITINPECPYLIIRRPAQLTAVIDGGGNLCPGDPNPVPINVEISGGNQPYTVTWPSGNPGLPNGSQSGLTEAQAAPFTFGVTPSSTITYSGANVMVFDSKGCVSSKTGSALVNVSDVILFAVDYSDISCFGGNDGWISIEVDGTGTYSFSIDNGENYVEGEENSPVFTFENLSIGTYKIRIKDQYGCESPDCDEEP